MRLQYAPVSIPYEFFYIKFTAGIGVFAGRAFKKGEIILRSSMTLLLPRNIPGFQTLLCYGFGHNKTHMFLDLDYGSIINHHESANAAAMRVNNMYYRVRGFSVCESQCSKTMYHTCMHTYLQTCINT